MYISTKDAEIYRRQLVKVKRKLEFCKQKKQEFAELGDFSENEEYHIYRKKVEQCTLEIARLNSKLALPVKDEVGDTISIGSKINIVITQKDTGQVKFEGDLVITSIETNNPLNGYLCTNSSVYTRIEGQKNITWEMQSARGVVHVYDCKLLDS